MYRLVNGVRITKTDVKGALSTIRKVFNLSFDVQSVTDSVISELRYEAVGNSKVIIKFYCFRNIAKNITRTLSVNDGLWNTPRGGRQTTKAALEYLFAEFYVHAILSLDRRNKEVELKKANLNKVLCGRLQK